MKKSPYIIFITVFISAIFFNIFLFNSSVKAQDSNCSNVSSLNLDGIGRCLEDIKKAYSMSVAATKPLESQLISMQTQIKGIKNRVATIEGEVLVKKGNIEKAYKNLEKQEKILNQTIRDFYIKSYYNSPILAFLSQTSASKLTQVLAYQKAATDQDKVIITNIALSINDLSIKQKALEKEQASLVSIKATLDQESTKLEKIVGEAKAYQGTLSGQIANLSARQQEILTARSGTFTASIGDSELADDYNASIKGFRESAPSGSFAVFAFGAYTHRNGMSQYGALGHIKNQGWNYEQILKHYYPGVSISDADVNKTIAVNGINSYGQSFNNESFNFEDYLKHIYEVPSSWPTEILKAQAIAARSYAYGKSTICPGQGCQEFKREENSDAWKAAVEATRGKVMTGGPGNWQYSSTTGGWVNGGVGWDTTDGGGGSNFIDKSYEKLAGSPWIYKAWYTETYRNNSDKCGRSNPWLSGEELADIINATRYRDERVTPVTTSCWGGNPYSHEELRAKSNGPSSVSSVSVSQGNGTTTEVVFQTNIGEIRMSGSEFKTAFNVRAPGRLSIPQSGFAFFNIEKK